MNDVNEDLVLAVYNNDQEAVQEALNAGADINTHGGYPIKLANILGNSELANYLILNGSK